MVHDPSINVRPTSELRLRLREDLVFTPQYTHGEIAYYILEDTLTSRFFRLGVAETRFARQMDGQTTIQDAMKKLSIGMCKHRLTDADAIALCHWFVEMDLVSPQDSRASDRVERRAELNENNKRRSRWNPLSVKMPLLKPDRFLERALPYCHWMFSRWFVGAWLILVFVAVMSVIRNWQRFVDASTVIFSVENGWWLFGCWVGLKLVHEAAHGLCCRRFGGSVHEAGIQCLWFVPLPYVDVTSCWRFSSRWPRVMVAAAGVYAEFFVAAIAAVIWANTEAGWLNFIAYNLVCMASLTTILFNANPLMKLDGYYIFSDLVDIPNLYQHGQRRVQNCFDRFLFGWPTAESSATSSKSSLVFVYGWLSLAWRLVLSVTLTIAMAQYAGQTGFWVAAIVMALWMGPTLRQFGLSFFVGRPGLPPRRFRVVAMLALFIAGSIGLLVLLPWPGRITAPAIVEYTLPVNVRADGNGQVVAVHVTSGQRVEQHDLLLTQENRELVARIGSLRIQIQQLEIRERRFQQKSQLASKQAEVEQRRTLEIELSAKKSELAELEVRAPHSGIVDHPGAKSLQGRYLKKGDEIMRIATESNKELRVAISQQDLESFSSQIDRSLRVDVPGLPTIEGWLRRIEPRASVTPIDPALASVHGGSLPVRPTRDRERVSSREDESYELLSPYLEGIVSVDATTSSRLLAGQRATVTSIGRHESIGEHLYRSFEQAFRIEQK